jgi:RNA polymerase sigma-70 factor, ECF subfamily
LKIASGKSDVTDAELLSAMAEGDAQALGALYDRYAAILLGLILRILHGRSEAEDVLQETFLQAWQRAGDYDPSRGRPFLWLSLLARSRALDRARAVGARARAGERAAHEPRATTALDASAAVGGAEEAVRVRDALASLPDSEREALSLAYFEGLSQSEIAARTGTPLGTVKTHTRTGLRKLRDLLGDLRLGR